MGEKKKVGVFEVLEPNWHAMHNRLQNANSIDKNKLSNITTFSLISVSEKVCFFFLNCSRFVLIHDN
ncbi:hypothetical protein QYF36_001066 [Acer negundo]|nr:hypothetical protein QYF36_001066 [Acer negundo]